MSAYFSTHVHKSRGSSNDHVHRHATRIRTYVNTCTSRGMHVLYKSACVYRMPVLPASARAPYLSWPSDINYVPCLFNTNLAFMKRSKKKGGRGQQDKNTYPRTEIIFFVSTALSSFTVLAFCFEDTSSFYCEFACRLFVDRCISQLEMRERMCNVHRAKD